MNRTIWKVIELSSPVDVSSMKRAFAGPTSISPEYAVRHLRTRLEGKTIMILLDGEPILFVFQCFDLPVVTRFFWPPEMSRLISLPTTILAPMSNPRICPNQAAI